MRKDTVSSILYVLCLLYIQKLVPVEEIRLQILVHARFLAPLLTFDHLLTKCDRMISDIKNMVSIYF